LIVFSKLIILQKTRYAHQVSALALAKLQEEAFTRASELFAKQAWGESIRKSSPMFHYWDITLFL